MSIAPYTGAVAVCMRLCTHPDCVFHIERIFGVTYVHTCMTVLLVVLDLDGELTEGSN